VNKIEDQTISSFEFNADDGSGKWEGKELGFKSDPLTDPGIGKPMILRYFEFVFKPGLKEKPTKQQLFNYHWPQIRTILWGDGLVANTDVDPRVKVGRKKYKIILLCEPKFKTMVADRPQTLQQLFNKK